MTLLRLYLQFFNSGAAWTVYAARNQNLSLSPPAVETHYNPPQQEGVHTRRQGHSSETMQEWTQRKLTKAKNHGKRL